MNMISYSIKRGSEPVCLPKTISLLLTGCFMLRYGTELVDQEINRITTLEFSWYRIKFKLNPSLESKVVVPSRYLGTLCRVNRVKCKKNRNNPVASLYNRALFKPVGCSCYCNHGIPRSNSYMYALPSYIFNKYVHHYY